MGTQNRFAVAVLLLSIAGACKAQDSLLDMLVADTAAQYTSATFKSTRVINGQSVENLPQGVLDLRIGHRFGFLSTGIEELFGLDQAAFRLGFDYGLTDRLMIGVGRSTYQKTLDGFVKYKLLRQCDQGCTMPITLGLVAATSATTLVAREVPWYVPGEEDLFRDRLSYSFQAVVGRKFSEALSLQLTPGLVHRNLVADSTEHNDLANLGVQGRVKLGKRVSLNVEYFWVPAGQGSREGYHNSLAAGFDIQTGGHVFQLHLTNSTGMFPRAFIAETEGDFFQGDIHFGFNISRVFKLYDPKAKARKKEAETKQ